MIYLDNAATTKVHEDVKNGMVKYLSEVYGNTNSKYYDQAIIAKKALDDARESVAKLINCKPTEIIFTGGASESNNMVLKGIFFKNRNKGNHIVISAVEHSSLIETAKFLSEIGAEITILPVNEKGEISLNDLTNAIKKTTILVSVIWSNNELGTINNIQEISNYVKSQDILFHTDATQAIGKLDVDMQEYKNVDFLSLSAHKFYGPKGVGVLFIRENKYGIKIPIESLIHGGEQEFGLRGGTIATHQVVGLGIAADICKKNLQKNIQILKVQEQKLKDKLNDVFKEKIEINNYWTNRVPGLINITIKGINNAVFLKAISSSIAGSSGSACSNRSLSHVLKAVGMNEEKIKQTIRFSLSPYDDYNNFNDIE